MQLDLLKVELFLVLNERLETDLHLTIIRRLRFLYFFNIKVHLSVGLDQRGVLILRC